MNSQEAKNRHPVSERLKLAKIHISVVNKQFHTLSPVMFSEDSHQHGKAPIPNKPKFVDKSSHSEDDKKMFHWMRGDDSVVKMAVNNSEKVPGSDDKEFVLFHQGEPV